MNEQQILAQLNSIEGRIVGLLNLCQAVTLESGRVAEIVAAVRQLAEIQQSKLLASPTSEAAIDGHKKVIDKFLEGLPRTE